MSLKTKRQTIDNIELVSTELEFCAAADLVADMTAALAPIGAEHVANQMPLGIALGDLAKELVGGKLTAYIARVLAGTTIIVRDEKLKVELIDSRAKLDEAFAGRKKYIYPAIKLALEVSFKDFLEGLALVGIKPPKLPKLQPPPTPSSSEDSSQSTGAGPTG